MFAKTARQGLAETGTVLIAAAVVSAAAGGLHMLVLSRAYGEICGLGHGGLPHCAACSASVLLFAAGLAVLALALPQAQGQTVRGALTACSARVPSGRLSPSPRR